jgi:hypothetical protein
LNKITDLKSEPKGRVQKFNIARGESKEKKFHGEKQNSPTLKGYQPIYPS